jgi:phosphoserine phosphatase
MKHLFKPVSFHRLVVGLVGGLVVLSLAFTFPNAAAMAAAVAGPTPTPRTRDYSALTQAYQHEQSLLSTQQANLSKASGATSKIQDLISKAQAKGLDTSALSSALATFQTQLATAQGDDSTAGSTLAAHNGFDGNGNVTNPTAARQTVQDAAQSLKDAHSTLMQATSDLMSAVKAWEEANQDQLQNQDLAKAYQNEQKWLTTQQGYLSKAGNLVTNVQDLISKAQAKGLDTSALSSALSTFQTQLAAAQTSSNNAQSILSAHNGFDGNGNVTDPTAAAQTVKEAQQSLLDAHATLDQATKDLSTAVKAWEEANKDKLQQQDLSKDYQNEQKWLSVQSDVLAGANQAATNVQNLISKAQAQGLDTSALSAALSAFQSQVANAQSSHNTAQGILSTHNGFDDSGNVTDQTAATQTVNDAHQSLLDAHNTLVQAAADLTKAVDAWRDQNHLPTPTPSASGS